MTIIFLNGAGSSGKTSIAKAIQNISDKPWLIIGIDSFIEMMPQHYTGFGSKATEGFQFIVRKENGKPAVACKSGEFGNKIVEAMPKVVRVLADTGFNIIIDEVLFGDNALKDYVKELANDMVYFIAIKCSLGAMEEREILRGDRAIGLSRDQYEKVHLGTRDYDVELDTTANSSVVCAHSILSFISNNPKPKAFDNILSKYADFIPLEKKHFELMLKWLDAPHVKVWWDKEIKYNIDLVKVKYGDYARGYKIYNGIKKEISAYIIHFAGNPVGYIQAYNAFDFPREGGVILDNLPENLAAVDWFIGDSSYTGKGFSGKILKSFLDKFIFNRYNGCFVDPEIHDKVAIKSYEKAGFKQVRTVNNSIWMVKERI
jgi:chloramphenicol 3-O-phosphotransferase/RimJ/RimL family protein N-acetyltransferase